MATVDGNVVAADKYGITQGDGGAVDKMAGGAGKDILQGHAKFNQYYGGGGDDTFKLVSKFAVAEGTHDGQSLKFDDQFAYITDFSGAGVAGGDFIALDGFDGSTLTKTHTGASGTNGAVLYYYSVSDFAGHTFNFMVNSLNGNELSAGDFGFYGVKALPPL
ncbi:hypothetical protein [Sphingomonas adhaesiva]|uniref:hypothetical protein n=1 Tax=Sphingomonas adhaesiva TaxID=28212 RepID=UPI002FFB4EE0